MVSLVAMAWEEQIGQLLSCWQVLWQNGENGENGSHQELVHQQIVLFQLKMVDALVKKKMKKKEKKLPMFCW
jgi:hypothetical protein